MLTITNTISGKKEKLEPIKPGIIKMYVCGITPYDRSHVGHGRCYVAFDVLYRLLKFLGYDVTYARNFTDIDDKLLNRAEQQLGSKLRYKELADMFIKLFHEDMQALNCISPNYEPCVTDNIPAIIQFIQGLIDTGHAYATSKGDVYFDIKSFADYGKLSKQNIDELYVGERVHVREDKKDPLDFALWKAESEGEFWKSPWGYGRPGWHIECSALADKYLGETIDMHGGGIDLIFPHHENEIAQSESLHDKTFARLWMHNGLVNIGKEKMSKSLGNIFTLQELFKQFDPMVVRFLFINHHYRSPIEFSIQELESMQTTYKRLVNMFKDVPDTHLTYDQIKDMPIIKKMIEFLLDDLNVPGMLGVLFEHKQEIEKDPKLKAAVKTLLTQVLGLTLKALPEKQIVITPEIQTLIEEREQARKDKNWKRADKIRDKLAAMGIDVQDKKTD